MFNLETTFQPNSNINVLFHFWSYIQNHHNSTIIELSSLKSNSFLICDDPCPERLLIDSDRHFKGYPDLALVIFLVCLRTNYLVIQRFELQEPRTNTWRNWTQKNLRMGWIHKRDNLVKLSLKIFNLIIKSVQLGLNRKTN